MVESSRIFDAKGALPYKAPCDFEIPDIIGRYVPSSHPVEKL